MTLHATPYKVRSPNLIQSKLAYIYTAFVKKIKCDAFYKCTLQNVQERKTVYVQSKAEDVGKITLDANGK